MTGESDWLWWATAGAASLVILLGLVIWRKGRRFAKGEVFRASRLSSGNHLFPTQVLITPTSVVHYTPGWIGKQEKTIHMAHVASVNIDTGLFFSDVLIETSGGTHAVACHGHRKGDAIQMKALIGRHQSDYYRGGTPPVGNTPTDR